MGFVHPFLLLPCAHQEGWPGEEREGPLVLPGEGDRGGWAGAGLRWEVLLADFAFAFRLFTFAFAFSLSWFPNPIDEDSLRASYCLTFRSH